MNVHENDYVVLTYPDGRKKTSRVHSVSPPHARDPYFTISEGFSKTHSFDLNSGEPRHKWDDFTARIVSKREYDAVNAENTRLEQEAKAARLREQEDPKYPLIRRFRAGDFEKWEKLTLEQLQQIAAWLDAK